MKKSILILFAIMIVMVASSASAQEQSSLPAFDVTFNGENIDSGYRQFPLLVYKDITYVPMTYHDCRFLGLDTKWDNDTTTLYIEKSDTTCAYRDYKWQWQNAYDNYMSLCNFNIVVNGRKIDNSKEEYPLFLFRDVTYFPLTWRFAVDEFGWEYDFSLDGGLSITSGNHHIQTIKLPHITGDVATDGNYYYYSGKKDDKHVVYRVSVADTNNPEVILELPDSPLTTGASFINSCGDIYITYFAGFTGVTGTRAYYKINADGSVTEKNPDDNYSYGKHGSSEFHVASDGIKVRGVHEFFDGPTLFYYEKDGVTHEAEKLPGRVRVGRRRNGIGLSVSDDACVQIFDGRIYYTASDLDAGVDTALYCIDTQDGTNTKIIDGVCGFYVYTGWLNEEQADSTMIIYDKDGYLMRYSELNGDVTEIENGHGEQGLILEAASGGYDVYTVQKTAAGNRCVVKQFACYAAGNGSINGRVLIDTKTGTVVSAQDGNLCVRIVGESPADANRLMVVHDGRTFVSSDAAECMFMYDNIMLYKTDKETVAKVELK